MKQIFKFILIFFLVIIVILVLGLSNLGFVPGLSAFFVKQIDLGVVPDSAEVVVINEQIGHEIFLNQDQIPSADGPVYEGEIEISGTYSDQQVTSVLDSWSKNWAITPFYNVQVKIHEDGSAEASGMLKVQEAINLAKTLGYSDDEIGVASKYATFINGDLPFYIKGIAEINNNQVSAGVSTIRIGNVTLPGSISTQVVNAAEDAVQRRIRQVPNLHIQKMNLSGGKLNISGKAPQSERSN